jgi:hypothetical protein
MKIITAPPEGDLEQIPHPLWEHRDIDIPMG